MLEQPHFFKVNQQKVIDELGAETLIHSLKQMMLIRNFELRAE